MKPNCPFNALCHPFVVPMAEPSAIPELLIVVVILFVVMVVIRKRK